jgi:DNA sulfur modification protein DndB
MQAPFEYVFPAIMGIQAGREYFVSMCPLPLIPKIFLFNEEELVPELRAQRILNKARIPEMSQYMVDNPDSYAFSALTASVDGDVRFESITKDAEGVTQRVGVLHIGMDSRFIINDGQHRRAAIETALLANPDLAHESIAVVFYHDRGLTRCQQMFADLNRHAIRPSKSLGVLYDHRDDLSQVTRLVVMRSQLFRDVVEMERSTLSSGSRKLFTLSAIYTANKALLQGRDEETIEDMAEFAREFWEEVAKQFRDWSLVQQRRLTAGEVRKDFIHTHGVVLQSIARAGNALIKASSANSSKGWKAKLKRLSKLDWSRSNAATWEGRALIGGRVSKSGQNVTLTTNIIKECLGLALTSEELRLEEALLRGVK